jgi:hypothetical protein
MHTKFLNAMLFYVNIYIDQGKQNRKSTGISPLEKKERVE